MRKHQIRLKPPGHFDTSHLTGVVGSPLEEGTQHGAVKDDEGKQQIDPDEQVHNQLPIDGDGREAWGHILLQWLNLVDGENTTYVVEAAGADHKSEQT